MEHRALLEPSRAIFGALTDRGTPEEKRLREGRGRAPLLEGKKGLWKRKEKLLRPFVAQRAGGTAGLIDGRGQQLDKSVASLAQGVAHLAASHITSCECCLRSSAELPSGPRNV